MSVVEEKTRATQKQLKLNTYPFWSPRFWHGMRTRDFLRLLSRNGWRIHPLRWAMALILMPITTVNSALYRLQSLLYGRRIQETKITQPPIFILGHWRSGTTHLHELLVRDPEMAFPSTYECFAPYHFLVSSWIIPRMMGFLLPRRRPMDNMAAGFDHPQEDEFALCAMGAPTPYFKLAFPNHEPPYQEFLNMKDVDPADLKKFRQSLDYFVKALTLKKNKRLVLKSPPHTGRIALLAEMFPDARFIHITRNPFPLFASTRRTWQALDTAQGFQVPHFKNLDEYVFECLERMYEGFERQRGQVDPARIRDIRYEDLVADPVGELRSLYEELDLGDFSLVLPSLQEYVEQQKSYQPNQHQLEPEITAEIKRRWAGYIEKYGYTES